MHHSPYLTQSGGYTHSHAPPTPRRTRLVSFFHAQSELYTCSDTLTPSLSKVNSGGSVSHSQNMPGRLTHTHLLSFSHAEWTALYLTIIQRLECTPIKFPTYRVESALTHTHVLSVSQTRNAGYTHLLALTLTLSCIQSGSYTHFDTLSHTKSGGTTQSQQLPFLLTNTQAEKRTRSHSPSPRYPD